VDDAKRKFGVMLFRSQKIVVKSILQILLEY
jgi:hypothetical protein